MLSGGGVHGSRGQVGSDLVSGTGGCDGDPRVDGCNGLEGFGGGGGRHGWQGKSTAFVGSGEILCCKLYAHPLEENCGLAGKISSTNATRFLRDVVSGKDQTTKDALGLTLVC